MASGLLGGVELGLQGRDLGLQGVHLAGDARIRPAAAQLGSQAHKLALERLELLLDGFRAVAARSGRAARSAAGPAALSFGRLGFFSAAVLVRVRGCRCGASLVVLVDFFRKELSGLIGNCLLYTYPIPRDT